VSEGAPCQENSQTLNPCACLNRVLVLRARSNGADQKFGSIL
jgi:hypothetical protein